MGGSHYGWKVRVSNGSLFLCSRIREYGVGRSILPEALWGSCCLVIDITKIQNLFGSTMEKA